MSRQDRRTYLRSHIRPLCTKVYTFIISMPSGLFLNNHFTLNDYSRHQTTKEK